MWFDQQLSENVAYFSEKGLYADSNANFRTKIKNIPVRKTGMVIMMSFLGTLDFVSV